MEETKEIKVQKMLAMRKFVRDHVFGIEKGNVEYLAQLDLDKADNTRLVISLQDLLDRTIQKKRRAEEHISSLVGMLEAYAESMMSLTDQLIKIRRENQHFKEVLKKRDIQISEMENKLQQTERQLSVFKELFVQHETQSVNVLSTNMEEPPMKAEPVGWTSNPTGQLIGNNPFNPFSFML